jgi:hypothetical protein
LPRAFANGGLSPAAGTISPIGGDKVSDNYLGRRIASPENVTPDWLSLAGSFRRNSLRPVERDGRERFPRSDPLDLILNPVSLFSSAASRACPTAIDTRVRRDAYRRFAVMVDAKAEKQIACSAF